MSSSDHRFRFAILLFCLIGVLIVPGPACLWGGPPDQASAADQKKNPRYIAYYFFTSKRCPSCHRIEKWTEESIETKCRSALKNKDLEWRTVNVERPENRHFIQDFKLYTKSVVIVEQRHGKYVRWKNLDKVWHLLRNREKFTEYVSTEIQAFMKTK